MSEIVPGVHQVDGLIPWPWGASVFLLVGERLTLVDSGLRGSLRAIERYVRHIGRRMDDLDLVILTHHHTDHAGSVGEIRREYGVRVAAHEAEVAYVEGRVAAAHSAGGGPRGVFLNLIEPLIRVEPVPVDIVLREGSRLDVLDGVTVVHCPGHTPGSICLYVPSSKLALVGDAFSIKSQGLELPTPVSTVDMDLARRSLLRVAELDLRVVCPSHGKPFVGDGSRAIREFLSHQR